MKPQKKTDYTKVYKYEVCRFLVAGVCFHDYLKMKLQPGDKLDIFGEPTNKHDKEAISLRNGSHKLGYVPAQIDNHKNKMWQLHNEGYRMKAFVVTVNPSNPTHTMFCVKVCTDRDSGCVARGLIQF